MDAAAKQLSVRQAAEKNQSDPEGRSILWSRHAIVELVNEVWVRENIETGFLTCEVIEDYPAGPRALPDCLVLGTSSKRSLWQPKKKDSRGAKLSTGRPRSRADST